MNPGQLGRVVCSRYLPAHVLVRRGITSTVHIKLSTCRKQTKICWCRFKDRNQQPKNYVNILLMVKHKLGLVTQVKVA